MTKATLEHAAPAAAPRLLAPWLAFLSAGACFVSAGYVTSAGGAYRDLYAELGLALPALTAIVLELPRALPLLLATCGALLVGLGGWRPAQAPRGARALSVLAALGGGFLACVVMTSNWLVFQSLQQAVRTGPDAGASLAPPPEPIGRPAPPIMLGDSVQRVRNVLGEPEHDADAVLRYYAQGLRVVLDGEAQVLEVELFGEARSDAAEGEVTPPPEAPLYRPQPWELGGIMIGMNGAQVRRVLGRPDQDRTITPQGRRLLEYTDRNMIVELDWHTPEGRVVGLRLRRLAADPTRAR